jgi:actin-related protein 6
MNNERFAVPEILFHPSDIGIQEMGIAEGVAHVVSLTPPGTAGTFDCY